MMKAIGRVWINDRYKGENIVTLKGLSMCANLISGYTTKAVKYLAIGIGTGDEDPTKLTLDNEIQRKEANILIETTDYTNDTIVYTQSFTVVGDTLLTEVGLFDDISGGNMFAIKKFDIAEFVPDGDTIDVTYRIQFKY